MSDDAHETFVEATFLEDGWTPACSCGWRGYRYPTEIEALAEVDKHLAAERRRLEREEEPRP